MKSIIDSRPSMMTPFQNMDGTKIMYHPRSLADWLEGKEVYPLHVDVGTSNGCNYRCRHCYLGHLGHKPSMLERETLLRLMRSFGRVGVKSIFFAGSGEPLGNKHTADAVVEAKRAGVDVSMATNGRLLDAGTADKMMPVMSWLRFSVQGGTAESYAYLHGTTKESFAITFKNLAYLCQLRDKLSLPCSVGVLTCLMPGNENEAPLIAKMAKEAGADYYTVRPPSVNPTRPLDCPVWDMDSLSEQLDATESLAAGRFHVIVRRNLFGDQEAKAYRKCLGLPFLTQVDGDGGVYACGVFVGDADYCYGNLNEQSFEEIWDSPRRKMVMERITQSGDFHACDNLCRLHNINKYLWQLQNPPQHVNFI